MFHSDPIASTRTELLRHRAILYLQRPGQASPARTEGRREYAGYKTPSQAMGSLLTLTNSIGFSISIAGVELFIRLAQHYLLGTFLPWLGLAPLLGPLAMWPLLRVR